MSTADSLKIELVEKSCMSHLFRHASEITKETKGGYLEGKIHVPKDLPLPVYARLSLVPSDARPEGNPFLLHPNLLHINMKLNKKNRRLGKLSEQLKALLLCGNESCRRRQEGELPEDVDWLVLMKIDSDGTVYRVCGTTSQPPDKRFQHAKETSPQANSQFAMDVEQRLKEQYIARQNEKPLKPLNIGFLTLPPGKEVLKTITKLETGPDGERYIEMGSRGLMLNVITPLQKFSRGGATITDVLKQRYQDIFQREISTDLLVKTEEVFTKKKEDRIKLQLVRLMFEAFSADPSLNFLNSAVSATITNSKSKECGPLQLHDVNPSTSCTKGNTKIFLLSFFKLVSDVRPVFILTDSEGKIEKDVDDDFRMKIKQPDISTCTVFNQCVLIFNAPEQDWEVIKELKKRNLSLHITAYRPSDGRMSNTSFEFRYVKHQSPGDPRSSDSEDENSDDNIETTDMTQLKTIKEIFMNRRRQISCQVCRLFQQHTPESLPLAKPGVHRRKNDILKYDDKKRPRETPAPGMTFAEVGGEGKIVDLKVEPDDLIDIGYASKRQKLSDDGQVQIKVEVDDGGDDIQEVSVVPRSTSDHLTMPCPPPLASISTGEIVSNQGIVVPANKHSNGQRSFLIVSSQLQQGPTGFIDFSKSINQPIGIDRQQGARPAMQINLSNQSVQNFRPTGVRMNGLDLSLNNPIVVKRLPSDLTGLRPSNSSPSIPSLIPLRGFQSQVNGLRLVKSPVSTPGMASTTGSGIRLASQSDLMLPEKNIVVTQPYQNIQISQKLLKTLQAMNDTKMVSGERESFVRVQTQK